MQLLELIVKLEALAAPDRVLDVEIGRLQDVLVKQQSQETGEVSDYTYHHYTESIDSALTLVPDGLDYVLRSLRGHAQARVGGAAADFIIKEGTHPVPAIALCVAALKARAALDLSSRNPDSGNN